MASAMSETAGPPAELPSLQQQEHQQQEHQQTEQPPQLTQTQPPAASHPSQPASFPLEETTPSLPPAESFR